MYLENNFQKGDCVPEAVRGKKKSFIEETSAKEYPFFT